MKNLNFLEYLMGFGIFTGAVLTALLVWFLLYEGPSPISYPGQHVLIPPTVKPGQTVEIYREIQIHKKTLIEIHRYIQTTEDGVVYTYDLPLATSNKDPGLYKQRRFVQLPASLIPGKYVMKTKVCWQPSIVKTQCKDAPDVFFTVI